MAYGICGGQRTLGAQIFFQYFGFLCHSFSDCSTIIIIIITILYRLGMVQ
jgi:hypothetical protein